MDLHRFQRKFASRLDVVTLGIVAMLPLAAQADPVLPVFVTQVVRPVVLPEVRVPATPSVAVPAADDERATFVAGPSPFNSVAKVVPNVTRQTLTAPVVLTANTSTDAMTVTQSGGGRAVTGSVTNASNGLSAIKGITNGTGSGINGVNSGTAGPAGKFQITASGSAQPGLVSTTVGTGNALQAVISNTSGSNAAAILGQSTAASGFGTGVEGDGNYAGVSGVGGRIGVLGHTTDGTGLYGIAAGVGVGVVGLAVSSPAVIGESGSDAGVYGSSQTGNGVTGITSTASGNVAYGVYGQGDRSIGVVGSSTNGTAVMAHSSKGYAFTAYADAGVAVYGYTGSPSTAYAGYFVGPLRTTSTMTAQSYATSSDRNEKHAFEAIDSATVLDKIAALSIGAWDYKDKPGIRHIGPMAQDFRAAFGLGADDTHIDLVDSAGVSLAAIQALQQQLKDKDARIAALEARAARAEASEAAVDALAVRLAALERTAMVSASLPAGAP